jgi:hypothetical protein
MKKLCAISICCCVCVLCIGFLIADGAETLKITKDHLDFRETPRTTEDNLLGDLRIGTPVEWTGNTSGDWFEVQAPNGQIGWVQKSGLSTPRSLPKVQEKPAPTPKPKATPPPEPTTKPDVTEQLEPTAKPDVSQPTSRTLPEGDLQKKILQFQGHLEEKDKKIGELTKELEQKEQQLIASDQKIENANQLREMDKAKNTDEVQELKKAIEQKDEALTATKVDVVKLQNQLQEQSRGAGFWERVLLYAISIPLNLVSLGLLGWIGLRSIQQKKEGVAGITPERRRIKRPRVISEQPISEGEQPVKTLSTPRTQFEQQVIIPESESLIIQEEELIDEDVVIDLADTVPVEQKVQEITGGGHDMEITAEELPEAETVVEIPAEEVEEIEELEEVGEHEEVDVIEEIGVIKEVGEPEAIPDVEEIGEIAEVEGTETVTPIEEQAEQVGGDFEYDIFAEREEEIAEQVEVAGEPFEMLAEQGTQIIEPEEAAAESLEEEVLFEEILEEPENIEEVEEIEEIEEQVPEEVEIIAAQEVETIEEIAELPEEVEMVEEVIEPEVLEESQEDQDIANLMKDMAEVEEFAGFAEQQREQEVAELLEDVEEVAEVEAVEAVTAIEEISAAEIEPVTESPIFEPVPEQRTLEFEPVEQPSPTLLEPEQVLIEPEYEPAEILSDRLKFAPVTLESPAEVRYDIELVSVGANRDHILRILSKLDGLTKSPEQLVDSLPNLLIRGATAGDAKKFQLLMKKFGAEIRLVKK